MAKQKQPENKEQHQADDERTVDAIYSDPPTKLVSYEALDEAVNGADADLAAEEVYDTQHTDGHTYNPYTAQEQGLVYTPPSDPPVLPSDGPQGAEVAAGFAPSMAESDPDVEVLPSHVDNNDADLAEDVLTALRVNSETSTLDDIHVAVRAGVVRLSGTVSTESDLALAEQIVAYLDGVRTVVNHLEVGGADRGPNSGSK